MCEQQNMAKDKYDNSESAVFYKPTSLVGVDLVIQEVGYEKCDSGHAWGPGKRPNYCLHYCFSGKGKLMIDNKVFEVHEGQIFYLERDTEVYYEADQENPWEYIWIFFNGFIVKNIINSTTFSNTNPVIDDKTGKMKEYFRLILDSFESKSSYQLNGIGYLYLLLELIVDTNALDNSHPYMQSIVEQSVSIIYSNFLGDLTVDYLASKVGFSRSQLYRIFKSEFGYGPKEYITRMKIVYAAELLKGGYISTNKAATEVGYNNYDSFAKSFKRIIGVLPTEFIKLNKEGRFVLAGTYLDFLHFIRK